MKETGLCLLVLISLISDSVLYRYGGITVGNIQKSVPASFGGRIPPMIRKIAVRRSAQVTRANWGKQAITHPDIALTNLVPADPRSSGSLQQQRLPQHAHVP